MTDTTRDAFEAWHNEIEVFATRYERLDELVPKEALFAAWQAATEQGKRQPLTNRQAYALVASVVGQLEPFEELASEGTEWLEFMKMVKAIEAAHGITATPQGKI